MANILHVERTANKITLGTTGTTINIDSHTASKTLALDASKNLESIQDLRTSASPTFAGLTLTGNITMPDDGWIGRSSSHCLLFDDTLTEARFQSQLVSAYFTGDWNVFELQNFYTGVGSGPSYNLYRARGTQASPSALVDGDVLGRISIRGYDGDTYENACLIKFWVDDTVGDGIVPSKMAFYTTDSSGVMDDRLTILGDGKIGIGTFTPDTKLQVVGDCKLGDDNTNYTALASDGLQTMVGTARVKKEFTIDAINLDKGNQGPDAVILGNSIGYSYDIGDDSVMNFEIPYDCDTSEDIKIEIYWYINEAYAANSGEVQWRAQWSACPANATEAIDGPTHTGTIDFGDQNIPTTAKFLTEVSGTIAAASIVDADFVSMTIDRVALDGGTDPTADPVIVQIEVEYTMNKLGVAT